MANPTTPLSLTVRDLMRAPVVTIDADADLAAADAIMQLKRIRHLPVLEKGKLVGLVTHRDLLHARVSSAAHLETREVIALERRVHARAVMRKDVATVSPATRLADAARQMLAHKYGCLPVLDGDVLVGILTEADLVDFLVRLIEHVER